MFEGVTQRGGRCHSHGCSPSSPWASSSANFFGRILRPERLTTSGLGGVPCSTGADIFLREPVARLAGLLSTSWDTQAKANTGHQVTITREIFNSSIQYCRFPKQDRVVDPVTSLEEEGEGDPPPPPKYSRLPINRVAE